MQTEDELFQNHIRDLAERSYQENRFVFTSFCTLNEQSLFHDMERELSYVTTKLYGGTQSAERVVIRFGSEEDFGYNEDFPIVCFRVEPLMEKFGEELTHRDYLGALMNLGVEREVLGDIYPDGKSAVFFCLESMADFVTENLTRVRHTSVKVTRLEECPPLKAAQGEVKNLQTASDRVDVVIAGVFRLSRSECNSYFADRKVFVNGRVVESNSKSLKEGDRVTLRGFGRFDYLGIRGTTRKGKDSIDVRIY